MHYAAIVRFVHRRIDPAGAEEVVEQAYITRETGEPLGYTSTLQTEIRDLQGGTTPTTLRFVETIRSIEQLEPTPQNLQKLTAFSRAAG